MFEFDTLEEAKKVADKISTNLGIPWEVSEENGKFLVPIPVGDQRDRGLIGVEIENFEE